MNNPDDFLYEYSVLRLVPRIYREEFINIGLIMMCKRRKWFCSRVIIDEKRIQALFPNLSCDAVKKQSELFLMGNVPFKNIPIEEKYRWLTAVKSSMLQTSPSHPGIIIRRDLDIKEMESKASLILDKEFDRLFKELVII